MIKRSARSSLLGARSKRGQAGRITALNSKDNERVSTATPLTPTDGLIACAGATPHGLCERGESLSLCFLGNGDVQRGCREEQECAGTATHAAACGCAMLPC